MKRRPDGRFCKRVKDGKDTNGKEQYKFIYGKSIWEVNRKVSKFEREKSGHMFADVARKWLTLTIPTVAIGTSKSYRITVEKHLIPAFSRYRMEDVKLMMLQELINKKAEDGYKAKTLKEIRNIASRIMEYAIDNDIKVVNRLHRVKIPKYAGTNKRRALNTEEQNLFIEHYRENRMGVPALVLLETGIRRGELMALTWNDFDFKNKVVNITKAAAIRNNQTFIKAPKTESGIRKIPLSDVFIKILEEEKMKSKSAYVCPSVSGSRMSETAFRKAWESYIYHLNLMCGGRGGKRAKGQVLKMDNITPHMLRHTFATNLYDAGVDIKNAQRYLGHSDINTTLRIYVHLSFEKEQISDETFNAFFSARLERILMKKCA